MKRSAIVALTIVAILSIAAPASAATPTFGYLDPATGTLIVSAIIGGFAAFGLFFKKFWYRIKGAFTGDSRGTAVPDSDAGTTGRSPDTRSHSD